MRCLAQCGTEQERYRALYGAGKRTAVHCILLAGALLRIVTQAGALPRTGERAAAHTMAWAIAPPYSVAFDRRTDVHFVVLAGTLWTPLWR